MESNDALETTGRLSSYAKLYLAVLVIVIVTELIGIHKFPVGPGTVVLLPMLYAVIIGLLITPQVLGTVIAGLKKVISEEEVELAGAIV
ncbi:MAG: DUF3100 domain-containing protein, partial [Syntrophobacterales bacterium]